MTRYIADCAEAVRIVELDGLTAVYHRPSGMTHLLATPAPQILAVIANDAAEPTEIIERMGRLFEVEAGESARQALDARLVELEAAGLVRRA